MSSTVDKFLQSDINDFDKFLETLVASDIPQDVRPEQPSKKKDEDDEEKEEKCNKK